MGSKIVLIDEATSSLDMETEKRVQSIINDVFADCTVITVSHRVHVFDKMNAIIRVEDGEIVEVVRNEEADASVRVSTSSDS